MAISNRDQLIASLVGAQRVEYQRSGARTTVANVPFSLMDVAGQPGAGTLAGANTANGVVPDSTVQGFPPINSFGGNTGYLHGVQFGSSVACRLRLYDLVFKAGAYAFNAATSLTTQPSYSARMPGGDYKGTQIWLECVTAFTGTPSVAVTYTNDAGTAAQTTGTVSWGAVPIVGRMLQMPLAAGDNGVQKIESVTATVATVGTFNVLVMRPLWSGRVILANGGDLHGPDKTGMPILFSTSALFLTVEADSTASGIPEVSLIIGNG